MDRLVIVDIEKRLSVLGKWHTFLIRLWLDADPIPNDKVALSYQPVEFDVVRNVQVACR